MENRINKKFSLIARAKGFVHATRGLYIFLKTTHNIVLHVLFFALVISAGFFLKILMTEWLMVILVSGILLISEAFNTAIEIDIDLTSPTYHPYARDTKDVAAGAVLLSGILAVVVDLIIFVPYIQLWLGM